MLTTPLGYIDGISFLDTDLALSALHFVRIFSRLALLSSLAKSMDKRKKADGQVFLTFRQTVSQNRRRCHPPPADLST